MKYLLLIIIVLSSALCTAQNTVLRQRTTEDVTPVDDRLFVKKSFALPTSLSDTPSLNGGIDILGSMVYVFKPNVDTGTYVRTINSFGTRIWLKLSTGVISGGPSPSAGVASFNTRTGAVVLTYTDIIGGLGFTPMNPNGTDAQYFAGNGIKYPAGNLTKTDDSNILLTLTGTPLGSLLKPVNLAVSWSGLLPISRGGVGISTVPTANQFLIGNGSGGYKIVSFTAGANMAIDYSTPGQVIFSSSGSGGSGALTGNLD